MAYIGAEPVPGQNREVDDISSGFNGNATAFTLQVSSVNVSPESANNILINLGGVLQNPGTDYTIAASTITFTTAPAAGLSFFGLILGAGINTATVADGTIGTAKVVDNSITADKLAHTSVTAGSYTTADITVDAQGRITAAANGTIATAEIADGAVNNAKVNASAAIAGTKISPDFGSQNIVTTGSISGAAGTFTGDVSIPDTIVHTGDTNTKIRFPAADTISAETAGSERARVDSSGRLLLGHGSARPVAGNTNRIFQIENGTSDIAGASIVRNSANSGGPFISFGKSRGSSTGATTIVQDGDTLGTISFAGADGTNLESRGADIFAQVDGTPGVDDMPGRLIFSTTPDGSVSPTERMRINSSGNVGIGTTSPLTDAQLTISAADTPGLAFQRTGSGKFENAIQISSGHFHFKAGADSSTIAGLNDVMKIESTGNVGIGTTSPSARLSVVDDTGIVVEATTNSTDGRMTIVGKNGNGQVSAITRIQSSPESNSNAATSTKILNRDSSNNVNEHIRIASNGDIDIANAIGQSISSKVAIQHGGINPRGLFVLSDHASFQSITLQSSASRNTTNGSYSHFMCSINGVADKFRVLDSGNCANTNNSFSALSDETLKENIVDAGSQWDDIKNIKVRKFNFKEGVDPEKPTLLGVIAQEAELVCPKLVESGVQTQAGVEKEYKTFKYSVLYMKAIKCLQEAQAKIETLETKVAALEAA